MCYLCVCIVVNEESSCQGQVLNIQFISLFLIRAFSFQSACAIQTSARFFSPLSFHSFLYLIAKGFLFAKSIRFIRDSDFARLNSMRGRYSRECDRVLSKRHVNLI